MPDVGFVTLTYEDYTGEVSPVRFLAQAMTAANHDAQVANAAALADAIATITRGLKTKVTQGNVNDILVGTNDDPEAQREEKWLGFYLDGTTGKEWRFELPCALMSKLDPNSRHQIDMTDADVIAFKAAFEAYVRSPDGNTVTLQRMIHVGRNT